MKKLKRKRKNPNTPTNKENMAVYLNAAVVDISTILQRNFDKLEKLSKEDLQELIQMINNFEQWILFKLELVKI